MAIKDNWKSADAYEYFMGRWSKQLAPLFLDWLKPREDLSWLDLGCGTGALTAAIQQHKPLYSLSIDPSAEFIEKAKASIPNHPDFATGSATDIPGDSFDIIVSGLAMNFFPDLPAAFAEMKRVLKENGTIAAYVWDYAGRMDFLRIFWNAVNETDPASHHLDEGIRFSICDPAILKKIFEEAGLANIETTYIDIDTRFVNFEDYWDPFLGGQGPAPGYLASLNKKDQEKLRSAVYKKLPMQPDGSIKLLARAIAIKGNLSQ